MKKGLDTYTQDKDFCCPLGSLTLMLRKIGKMFRDHLSNLNVTNSQSSIFLILLKMDELSQSELGKKLDMDEVITKLKSHLIELFEMEII